MNHCDPPMLSQSKALKSPVSKVSLMGPMLMSSMPLAEKGWASKRYYTSKLEPTGIWEEVENPGVMVIVLSAGMVPIG